MLNQAAPAIALAKESAHLCSLERPQHTFGEMDSRGDLLEAAIQKIIGYLAEMEVICKECMKVLLKDGKNEVAEEIAAAAMQSMAGNDNSGCVEGLIAFGEVRLSALPSILE